MSVTLEVSKLSGWLNACASYRESKEGHMVQGEVYGSGGSRRWTTAAQAARRGGARLQIGSRARTENMTNMLVTLDVSKLSGWLKLDVIYRVKRRIYDTGREVRTAGAGKAGAAGAGGVGTGGGASSVQGGADRRSGASTGADARRACRTWL